MESSDFFRTIDVGFAALAIETAASNTLADRDFPMPQSRVHPASAA
jgi:hypothetical protein